MRLFITGISHGVGLETTRHFLDKGDTVFGVSRSMSPQLEHLMENNPGRLVWHSVDLGETDELESRLANLFSLDDNPIDAFVDNAALLYKDLTHRIDSRQWTCMANVDIVAPVIVTKLMIRNFLHFRTKGSIVHLSSICAHRAFVGLSLMGAAKAAIEAFSRTTAMEYGRFGIRSNTVVGGLLDVGMASSVNDRLAQELIDVSSIHQLVDIHSVVDMIDYLVSDHSCCITGQNIHIDCGIV